MNYQLLTINYQSRITIHHSLTTHFLETHVRASLHYYLYFSTSFFISTKVKNGISVAVALATQSGREPPGSDSNW